MDLERRIGNERELLERMRKDESRYAFCCNLYYKFVKETKIKLPVSCISALDSLIRDYAGKYDKQGGIAFVESSLKRSIKPNPVRFGGYVYTITLLGKRFNIYEKRWVGDPLDVLVDVEKWSISARYKTNSGEKKVLFTSTNEKGEEAFLRKKRMTKEEFAGSKGVAIRRMDKRGMFTLGHSDYSLGKYKCGSTVIVFFDRGKTYFYDVRGNRMTTVEYGDQPWKIRVGIRIGRITSKMRFFDLERYVNELYGNIKTEWFNSPESFSDGINYAVDGFFDATTNRIGEICLYHYKKNGKGTRNARIGVGIKRHYEKVRVYFKGPYIAILDKKGGVLNADEFKAPVNFMHLQKHSSENVGIISCRTVPISSLSRSIGDHIYRFSKRSIREAIGRKVDFDYLGILAYINPINGTQNFEILVPLREYSDKTIKIKPWDTRPTKRYQNGVTSSR